MDGLGRQADQVIGVVISLDVEQQPLGLRAGLGQKPDHLGERGHRHVRLAEGAQRPEVGQVAVDDFLVDAKTAFQSCILFRQRALSLSLGGKGVIHV